MPSRSRRALLRALGVAAVGLAGCQELTGSTPTDEPTQTATAAPSPTDSPTATPTPEPLRCDPGPRSDEPWPLPRRSPANDAYAEAGATFDGAPSVDWSVEPTAPEDVDARDDDATFVQPVVAGDRVFVVRRITYGTMVDDPGGHALQAREAATGDLEWSVDLPKTPTTPAVRGDLVLVASRNEPLHAVDRRDGTVRWSREFPANVDAIVPTTDEIYVALAASASRDAELYAFEPDGTTRWSRQFEDGGGLLAVGPDHAFASGGDGSMTSLGRADGADAWSVTVSPGGDEDDEVRNVSTLTVTDCGAFALAGRDVYAFDLDGELRWRVEGSYRTLATDGETLYGVHRAGHEGDWDRQLHARDAGTGECRWERAYPVDSYEHPALSGDAFYQPFQDELVAVGLEDGEERWRTTPKLGDLALGEDALYGVDPGHVSGGDLVALR